MLSKRFKFILKSFLSKAAGASLVALLLLCGTISKFEPVKIQADTNVQINPFVWLCSYFGINIYTDAQEINDAFYDAISLAWATYQESLQDNGQRVSIDDIIGSISWDSQEPKMVKITGWAFNALKSFADYLNAKVTTASEALQIGDFETSSGSYFTPVPYQEYTIGYYEVYGSTRLIKVNTNNNDVRMVIIQDSPNNYYLYAESENAFDLYNKSSKDNNWTTQSASRYWYSQVNKYLYQARVQYTNNQGSEVTFYDVVPIVQKINNDTVYTAVYYTFGLGAGSGDVTLNDVYALPEPAVLDDLIGAADPNSEVQIDIEDSDIPWSTAATLQDILDAINDLTDSYVIGNTWPDVAGLVDALSQSITNEITEVDYPNAITWEVPVIIGTPNIAPLIEPECPTLSACLVAGIQDVGSTMSSVIDANSNVSNYVSASLFLGLSLMILGAFI